MMLNSLFVQKNTQNSAIVNPKQTKTNSPSYLFSDIIRLLNDSSQKQNLAVSKEANQDNENKSQIYPSINNSLNNNNKSKLLNESNSIDIIENFAIESEDIIKIENINISDSLNIIPSLKKMYNDILENGINLKNVGALNNLNDKSTIDFEKELNASGNLFTLLNNNEILELNLDLFSSSALNIFDKQQLQIKKITNESDQNKIPENNSLDKELKKIATLLFGLLTQQNNLSDGNIIEEKLHNPLAVNNVDSQNIISFDTEVKDPIFKHLNSNKSVILNINMGSEKLKIEINSIPSEKTINESQTPKILPDTENLKIEIITESDKKINNEFLTSKNLHETENLKIEIISETEKKISNKTQTTGILNDTELFKKSDTISSKEVKNLIEINSLKDITPKTNEKILNKNVKENISTVNLEKINSVQLNPESFKKFILKITQETVIEHSQNLNTLKVMLQKMFINEKIEVKIITPDNNHTFKTGSMKTEKLLSKNKKVIVKTINNVSDINQKDQIILKGDLRLNTDANVSSDLAEPIDNIILKSQETQKEVIKTEINSNKNISDTINRQVVSEISETLNKDTEQKPSSDKKELFDLNSTVNQVDTLNTNNIKNETTKNIFKMFGENNVTVKASNLIYEMSRFFEQGKSKSIVLKLQPDNLGKVKIVLDVADKIVHANIQVNNETVKQIVQNNINTLIDTLNLSGLQLSSFNVSLENNNNKESKTNSQKKKSSNMHFNHNISEDNVPLITKSMGYNTYDFII